MGLVSDRETLSLMGFLKTAVPKSAVTPKDVS